ncbi:MAG TPA: hypothetical protein VGP31_07470 [Planosporangium sp.]|nr:hypothetical protein [Planosporangium sp.]
MALTDHDLGRRAFLARIGLLGAAGLIPPSAWSTAPGVDPLGNLIGLLGPVLRELARDTWNGFTVFVVPGPDAYSRAQGTPRAEPGAIEAKTPDFIMASLDDFLPVPRSLVQPVLAAVATGLSDSGIALPAGLLPLPAEIATLDRALRRLVATDSAVPLSVAVAMLLNLLATQVDPLAVQGPFLSPFARLSYAEKAHAMSLLEGPDSDLVALLDTEFPQPLRSSVSGLLKFVGGALLEFAAFGAYSEFAVYDARSRSLTARPVGWQLTGFNPPRGSDGYDDLIGYYQGRREVRD